MKKYTAFHHIEDNVVNVENNLCLFRKLSVGYMQTW